MERMRLNGWIILYWVGYHVVLGGLYFSKKQTGWVLINEVLMAFSGCDSYHKDTCDYDEYIAKVYCIMC